MFYIYRSVIDFKLIFIFGIRYELRFLVLFIIFASVQFSSIAQSCMTLFNPMNHSTPGLPVHDQLSESTQTHMSNSGPI